MYLFRWWNGRTWKFIRGLLSSPKLTEISISDNKNSSFYFSFIKLRWDNVQNMKISPNVTTLGNRNNIQLVQCGRVTKCILLSGINWLWGWFSPPALTILEERFSFIRSPGQMTSLTCENQLCSCWKWTPSLCFSPFVCHFQKSWDIALGPFKQIPMNLFIMYMAGNSISIFPIMMVGMMFLRPVKALLAIKSSKNVYCNYFFVILFMVRMLSHGVASCTTATPVINSHCPHTSN